MPKDAPERKVSNARALGAEVIFYNRFTESREEMSREIAKEKNLVLINPYDALETIYGLDRRNFRGLRGWRVRTRMGV